MSLETFVTTGEPASPSFQIDTADLARRETLDNESFERAHFEFAAVALALRGRTSVASENGEIPIQDLPDHYMNNTTAALARSYSQIIAS